MSGATGVDDLAPDIFRQRLVVEGFYTAHVDEAAIRGFFDRFTSALGLRPYAEPTVYTPQGLGREGNQGYDAFVPLVDSGVSLYVWSTRRFLAVVAFSCTPFDAGRAASVTREYFAMTDSVHRQF